LRWASARRDKARGSRRVDRVRDVFEGKGMTDLEWGLRSDDADERNPTEKKNMAVALCLVSALGGLVGDLDMA
jgi:hypothetical protein